MSISPATEADLPAILAIVNNEIARSTANYRTEPLTLNDRKQWLAGQRECGLPVIVARNAEGAVVGWGSLSPMRAHEAYAGTVENSVYVAAAHRRAGIGAALLGALVAEARRLGLHAIVAWIDSGAETSLRMHERAGFVEVGRLREVGRKFDRWLDVVLMELLLDAHDVGRADPGSQIGTTNA